MDKQPTYKLIAARLGAAIADGLIPPGAILKVADVAKVCQSSRSPVKQAFEILETRGAVHPHDGQGFVVSGAGEPMRFAIAPQHLAEPGRDVIAAARAHDDLYFRLERELILHSMSGSLKVNELALARHFGIGRSVARDLMYRAHKSGIVARGDAGHWRIVGLDETRCRNVYDLRILLEPVALTLAAPLIPRAVLQAMRDRLAEGIAKAPALAIGALDQLENDLHQGCLGYCPNGEIIEALARTAPTYICGKYLQITLSENPTIDFFMHEHIAILDRLIAGEIPTAARMLAEHLTRSKVEIAQKLKSYISMQRDHDIDYIIR